MKTLFLSGLGLSLCLSLGFTPPSWTVLFDGKTIKGWHSYQKKGVSGWFVENGTLTANGLGGDLLTDKEYKNFELVFEFKIPAGSNSGVLFKVIESEKIESTYMTGPEYQIIDDKHYVDGEGKPYKLNAVQLSGANYDLHAPADQSVVKPVGVWNNGRLVVRNNHVEHYLNDRKVVDYVYGSKPWRDLVRQSKFARLPYAIPHDKGRIALQSHNPKHRIWFRNIRIREF